MRRQTNKLRPVTRRGRAGNFLLNCLAAVLWLARTLGRALRPRRRKTS